MNSVLLISHDIMGPKMAGPGIRNAGLASVLMPHCNLQIVAPEPSKSTAEFHVQTYQRNQWRSIQAYLSDVDVVIANGDTLAEFPQIAQQNCFLVVDSYDPHTAENLLWQQEVSIDLLERWHAYEERRDILFTQCQVGDFLVCASEVQRDWLLGLLESQGRLNPWTLADDPSFRRLIDVVPYGLPSEAFSAPTIDIPGVKPGNKVILWGGGVWPWLDAQTAVKALPVVMDRFPDVRLLFPGTRHPNPAVPAIKAVDDLKALAVKLGLADDYVLFGDWVSREQWPGYLARADVGLSLHPDTIETHLAYRSRLFEYIWAGLPMVVTGGDATSDLVKRYDLGYVAQYHDIDAVAQGIIKALEQPKTAFTPRFDRARADLTWQRAAMPLVRYIQSPYHAADKQATRKGVLLNKSATAKQRLHAITVERNQAVAQVQAYERGRFMRIMRWLDKQKRRLRGHQ